MQLTLPDPKLIRRTKHFLHRKTTQIVLVLLFFFGIFAYLTNPFVRFTIISDPFNIISLENESISLTKDPSILVKDGPFLTRVAYAKAGWHILTSKFAGGPKARTNSVDQIIAEIHEERFDPKQPFLISGDHFSVLYIRSLGIFYNSILDPRTALNQTDWTNRQTIYLKTLNYALQTFAQTDHLSTTIVPTGPRSVTLINIYATPSDSLYSLLFALNQFINPDQTNTNYAYSPQALHTLNPSSQDIAQTLLDEHQQDLGRHLDTYLQTVTDPDTGLIKKNIELSGTKDLVKRQSAFYDNVMLWATQNEAQKLGISDITDQQLADLKTHIIDTFWLPEQGHFLEDLSKQAITNQYYSSDWLIAFQTGFLDPDDPDDQTKLISTVDYIRKNAIDQPFGVQYNSDIRRHNQHFFPRVFAPQYASTAIWSHWGMEYIKLLTTLAQKTGTSTYLEAADAQLSAYAFNIKRYRGYPEVYDSSGDFFRKFFYKSIRRTGWVVNYEQARAMHTWTRDNWEQFTN